MIKYVEKRDGRVVPFDKERIVEAIYKAARAVGGRDRQLAEELADEVVAILEETFRDRIPNVEDIQDIVEKVLIERGHARTAKAYILYRDQRKRLRDMRSLLMDVEKVIEGYLTRSDWRVHENSNIDYSFPGLMLHASGTVITHYTLTTVYPPEVAKAHIRGDFHIHDLQMGIVGYCAGWNLRQLLHEGFNGVPRKVESAPPRHFDTALGQMVNFLGTLQNEWAGAMAFNSFDTYLAPFVRKDKLTYNEVKQALQSFIFSINVASRWGGQTPFVNLTFDLTPPKGLRDEPVTIDGEYHSSFGYYGEFQKEMDMINKAFIELMLEGDRNGRVFTFPIPTYNLTEEFDWDSEIADLLFKMTGKYGIPYFSNFINSELDPEDIRSMCCHLRLDLAELRRNVTGGIFGSSDSTGSIGVVTINMPRIGYLARDEEEFLSRLSDLMELARTSLEIKRKLVERNIQRGLLPYTKRYLGTLRNHFSTIGLVGMNEALLNFMGKDIGTPEGRSFALKVMDFMLDKLRQFQQETGNLYNLEATPAEGTSYRLARLDKQFFPNIITAGKDIPYYTNSTQLPVNYTDDVFEAFELQEPLQCKYTGGTVLHIYLGEEIRDHHALKELIKRLAHRFRVPYFTVTPTFSICPDHGYIPGKHELCPICAKETEIYSRVVGYLRPVRNWNAGKQEEFRQRLPFRV